MVKNQDAQHFALEHGALGARTDKARCKPTLSFEGIEGFDEIINVNEYLVQQRFFIFVQHGGKSLSE
jgi:hypothetical protein